MICQFCQTSVFAKPRNPRNFCFLFPHKLQFVRRRSFCPRMNSSGGSNLQKVVEPGQTNCLQPPCHVSDWAVEITRSRKHRKAENCSHTIQWWKVTTVPICRFGGNFWPSLWTVSCITLLEAVTIYFPISGKSSKWHRTSPRKTREKYILIIKVFVNNGREYGCVFRRYCMVLWQ